jgi:lipopolysaccharide export system protein LptC
MENPGLKPLAVSKKHKVSDASEALQNLYRTKHAKNAGRHTRFVSIMKWVLPFLAVTLLSIAFILPMLEEEQDVISLDYSNITRTDTKLTMNNPKFLSSDQGNQQYTVTADTATQLEATSRRMALVNLQADISLQDGQWISLSAPAGVLDPEKKILDLSGGVNIFSDNGNQISAETIHVIFEEKRFLSPNGLVGHGPLGDISADSFVANQLAGTLRFEGNVKMTLYP